jgi:hypothetical protein
LPDPKPSPRRLRPARDPNLAGPDLTPHRRSGEDVLPPDGHPVRREVDPCAVLVRRWSSRCGDDPAAIRSDVTELLDAIRAGGDIT